MDNKSKDVFQSFDAKYQAEDAASSLLYKYNKKALKDSSVNATAICEGIGLTFSNEYIFKDGYKQALGFLAIAPQCIYDVFGNKLQLKKGSIIIEKTILDDENYKLYNYTVINLVAHYLLNANLEQDDALSQQLSFGLETTVSTKNIQISIDGIQKSLEQNKSDSAEYFAQALIMPKNRFKIAVNKIFKGLKVNRNSVLTKSQQNYILIELSNAFNVPEVFVLDRLKGLNYM